MLTTHPRRARVAVIAKYVWIALTLGLLSACTTIPLEQRKQARLDLDAQAEQSLDKFLAKDPTLKPRVDAAEGYFVGDSGSLMVGPLGGEKVTGVLFDRVNQTRTYLDISAFNVGAGLGSDDRSLLAIVKSRATMDKLEHGRWSFQFGAKSVAGESGGSGYVLDNGVETHYLATFGAGIGASLGLVRVSVNTELTDTGLANVGIPNTGSAHADRQETDAPRQWNRALPFLAQKVVDLGYDLPLPYGVGATFANVKQQMQFTNLAVGFNGKPQKPYPFVTFHKPQVDMKTSQVQVDAWVLPFMNVFVMAGKVSGTIESDVLLDGNQILESVGTDCSGRVPPPRCRILQDKTFTLPINPHVHSGSWGFGTILAGGWHDWFAVIPISINYAKLTDAVAEGYSLTVTPRGGYSFALGSAGSLRVFAGGNYLDSQNHVNGLVHFPEVDLDLKYTIDQRNPDRWNAVVGFNWEISRSLSVSAEYDGFIGTRTATIANLSLRF